MNTQQNNEISQNSQHIEILEKLRDKKAAIFIDDANLFYMQKRVGWEIDWKKAKKFFEGYMLNPCWFYYLGMPQVGKGRFENEKQKELLEKNGFFVTTKPLKKIYLDDQRAIFKHKCNFDVEIAFDIARKINDVDLIVVISGDSDFLAAKNFCLQNGKSFLFVCFEERVAWEIRRVHHLFFENIRDFIKK